MNYQNIKLKAIEQDGTIQPIRAKAYRPNTPPPHPVVIDLHGCSGVVRSRNSLWVKHLNEWGYAVLKPDSFNPRGDGNICDDTLKISPMQRLADVESTIRYILNTEDFDANNITLMGMSHGGSTAMMVHHQPRPLFSKLNGIIAFYPYCLESVPPLIADTLILIGELDDWTPADYCKQMIVLDKNEYTLELVVYPDAYHSFDVPSADGTYYGHRLSYHKEATADSIKRVKTFLLQHHR